MLVGCLSHLPVPGAEFVALEPKGRCKFEAFELEDRSGRCLLW